MPDAVTGWEPPFKVNHEHGAALRYTARDGRRRTTRGRRSFVYGRVYVDALLTGQAIDGVYEMQVTRDGPWHRLRLAPEDAAAALGANALSRGRLRRLRQRADYVLG